MAHLRARNVVESFKFALEGIAYTIRTQRNMRIHVVSGIGIFTLGALLNLDRHDLAMLAIVSAMVIVAEMFNTCIESTVDLYSRQRHPLAKIAKDVGAAAVLICALTAVVVGCLLLLPAIYRQYGSLLLQ